MNTARYAPVGTGTSSTSGLASTGNLPSVSTSNTNESWNGTNWTNENPTPQALRSASGCGTQTAALLFGGFDSGSARQADTYEWYGDGKLTETFTTSS